MLGIGKPAIVARSRENLRESRDRLLFAAGQSGMMAQRVAAAGFRELWDAEFRVYSQWGEDGILNFICESLGLVKPRMLEIGIGDFTECNSRFLAEYRSASVFAVDLLPGVAQSVSRWELSWRTTLVIEEWHVTPDNVVALMARAAETIGALDIVSLDIDGNDYWVLREMELETVSVLVLEYNPLLGAERAVTIPRNDHFDRFAAHYSGLYWGASLRAFLQETKRKGFTFIGTNRAGNNAFFIRSNRLDGWGLPVPDISDLQKYTDWRVTDARNLSGGLAGTRGDDRSALIRHLPLEMVSEL